MANVQQPQKLFELFKGQPLEKHGDRWDGLWKESFTPWDRGGPSMALHDLLADRPDLVPPTTKGSDQEKKKALVPGCGRGYDALLLASFGYDVIGLDFSAEAMREARLLEARIAEAEKTGFAAAGDGGPDDLLVYKAKDGVEKGKVTWFTGDFFADKWLKVAGVDSFDLIFDYTFFCALPVSARPSWAKRMAQLLSSSSADSRLVCLQWPSGKLWSTGGPPWGVRPEHYVAQLAKPGEEVAYDSEGHLAKQEANGNGASTKLMDWGLRSLGLIVPARTHKAGCLEDGTVHDRVAVFAHQQ